MQKTNETTRIVDVNHFCISDNVDEAAKIAYDLASRMIQTFTEICEYPL